MARLARAVFPGHPHHVTQRGNGRATTFFSEADYALYRDLLATHAAAAGWIGGAIGVCERRGGIGSEQGFEEQSQ